LKKKNTGKHPSGINSGSDQSPKAIFLICALDNPLAIRGGGEVNFPLGLLNLQLREFGREACQIGLFVAEFDPGGFVG
jgi:hypothetical protein